MRGAQDRAGQITARLKGWDPTAIIGDAYDVEKSGFGKDNPGPDAKDMTVSPTMETKPWESPDVRPAVGNGKHSDPFPGKPM